MSHMIAGMYERGEQIGAGGGGVVYRGRHLRLNKDVALKADKRRLSTGAEALQREVNVLKGLSHTYIPQVYDFVQEDGMVYTVMDYIDGESLKEMLKRGQRPTQPQVIKWACQLLEALRYLHGIPPHGILHGDIKPANIMLRFNGDICLIDYNIALFLGEDGAVKAGFSRGYASPEHYGADYTNADRSAVAGTGTGKRKAGLAKRERQYADPPESDVTVADTVQIDSDVTVADTARIDSGAAPPGTDVTQVDTDVTQTDVSSAPRMQEMEKSPPLENLSRTGSTTGGKGILLDVRSDIY
ncbi:MAG: serine/threonine protein kinase, partial [Blautia sp.]|nr:serine/threonine protein kinase [Blautia sp.]